MLPLRLNDLMLGGRNSVKGMGEWISGKVELSS